MLSECLPLVQVCPTGGPWPPVVPKELAHSLRTPSMATAGPCSCYCSCHRIWVPWAPRPPPPTSTCCLCSWGQSHAVRGGGSGVLVLCAQQGKGLGRSGSGCCACGGAEQGFLCCRRVHTHGTCRQKGKGELGCYALCAAGGVGGYSRLPGQQGRAQGGGATHAACGSWFVAHTLWTAALGAIQSIWPWLPRCWTVLH